MTRSYFFWFLLILCVPMLGMQDDDAITLVLLPDTQNYCQNHPEIFYSQTAWIAENAAGIDFVIHQGDITHNNSAKQWEIARRAFEQLDGRVPYAFVPGNHDTGIHGSSKTRDTDLYNQYLPYEKYSKLASFGGAFEVGKMDNTWYTFKAAGVKWLIINLEFGPRDEVLEWANAVVKKHRNHQVIVNTHAYMYSDDRRISSKWEHQWVPQNYGLAADGKAGRVNDGEQVWEKFVSRHKHILMVVSGHVLNDGTGTLVSEGVHGNKVYQMLANYQTGVQGSQQGGNGYLRILTIHPRRGTMDVQTYSPYLEKYNTDKDQQFSFQNVAF